MTLICADCLEWMKAQPDNSVALTFCSPPYEAARTYGIDFNLKGQAWADWCRERFLECVRITSGLVAWVVEGQTRNFRYSAGPLLLMADLHRDGVHLRKPPIFQRVGIPGSGGPDWLRNDYEFIICGTSGGKLPWSNNTAMGHPPKWAPGGEMSYRQSDGTRRNQWGGSASTNGCSNERKKNGSRNGKKRPSHQLATVGSGRRIMTRPRPGQHGGQENTIYQEPVLANPGNIVRAIVGGGVMGSKLCHENEAPFPEKLAEFFIRSFCPPEGIVLDPFAGSGTTLAVAAKTGRRFIGVDIRESQIEICQRRLKEVQAELF